MKNIEIWLNAYEADHRHRLNKIMHRVCVPLIVISLLGLLWSVPVPQTVTDLSPVLNWGVVAMAAALVFYFRASAALGAGMVACGILAVLAVLWLDTLPGPLWASAGTVFAVAWAGQFLGHLAEGRRPSFLRDLRFLMIGPLWLLAALYRQLRIPY